MRVLVAYATRSGSTQGIAECIAKTLQERGLEIELANVKKVKSVDGYDALVLGSGIYAGKVGPELSALVKNHQQLLSQRPVAFYSVAMSSKDDTPENRILADGYLKPLTDLISPLSVAHFAGALDYAKLNSVSRIILKLMKAPAGDYRDWQAIEDWASSLASELGRS